MNYDFSQLNDKEFEIMVNDLLSVHYGLKVDRFKPGKDEGVDGRFFTDSNKEVIIQSKHYLKTGLNGLLRVLKNTEVDKVTKLKPERYILVTSLPLSRVNKKTIAKIFTPFIKSEIDIFGNEDLNDLLSKHPRIEEKHYKLWINSTTVLKSILNNAIKGRSKFEIERIQRDSLKYIYTNNHEIAQGILKEHNVLIISGEPGIGKTTLADSLSLSFVSNGYEFISIEESLSEAENVYKINEKQVFYFDDFLGSNYFEAISDKKDSHIVKFIERIKNDDSKKFILTSRTNILNSGILHSSIFSNNKIRNNEFLIEIKSLTDLDKARILYNHIWFSQLEESFIDEIYFNKRYMNIINHKNYNPRLIEFITDIDRIGISDAKDYWSYIENTLDNPKDIWSDCFKRQNNQFVRALVNLVVFNGGSISEKELKESYSKFVELQMLQNNSHTEKDFESMSRLATKSFLKRDNFYGEIVYGLFNPSISDFVIYDLKDDLNKLKKMFESLMNRKSLFHLRSIEREEIVSKVITTKLKEYLFEQSLVNDCSVNYSIDLAFDLKHNVDLFDKILLVVKKVIKEAIQVDDFYKFLNLYNLVEEKLEIKNYDFLLDLLSNSTIDESDIKAVSNFVESRNIGSIEFENFLEGEIEEYLIESLDDVKYEIEIGEFIETHYGGYDEVYHEINKENIKEEFYKQAQEMLADFEEGLLKNYDVDIERIVESIDIDKLVETFLESDSGYDEESFSRYNNSSSSDIHDLFERS
ncbi:MAG: restriction endonuclease [Balneola sp.]